MKNTLSILFCIILATVAGCSSNDDDPVTVPVVETPSVFKMDVNGVEKYNISSAVVFKTENTILIKLSNTNRISFDASGQFGFFKLDLDLPSPGQTSLFYSFREFSSNYFDFNLEQIDEVHKRIKGTYSGYLYANEANLNSEIKYVSGYFDLAYRDLVPTVSGLKNHARINGNDWNRTNKYSIQAADGIGTHVIQHDLSDGEYKIMVNYDLTHTPVGTYNFIPADATNKIQLAKFDTVTNTYINYNCTGTLVITKREGDIFGGTYQFTAVNPNNPADVIQVTDGDFKLVYYYQSN
ncbi:MAG TPA: hypothetical protein VK528_11550 [Flavobacterium sp.]|nr:hypothetical protein [Flavobacterium sp.]